MGEAEELQAGCADDAGRQLDGCPCGLADLDVAGAPGSDVHGGQGWFSPHRVDDHVEAAVTDRAAEGGHEVGVRA